LGRERKRRSASQFDIGYGVRSSVRILATNEAKTHRPRFVKLIARGLSDSVMLSGVETHVRAFDVFPASAVHILSGFDTFKVTEDSSPDVAGRALEVPQGSTEKVLVGEKGNCRLRPSVRYQATSSSLCSIPSKLASAKKQSLRSRRAITQLKH